MCRPPFCYFCGEAKVTDRLFATFAARQALAAAIAPIEMEILFFAEKAREEALKIQQEMAQILASL
jgi:hypothetical protein